MHIEYKCHWPNCQYHTDERSLIEFHHIVPRELWPRLNKHVMLNRATGFMKEVTQMK